MVVALAATRSVDSPAADEAAATTTTPPTTTTTPTTTPPPTSPTPSTTAGPTTTVAPGLVDVSAVPDDRADTTLLLLGAGTDVSSLHLGTGELVTFESPVRFGTDEQVWSTSAGIVRQRFGPDETTSELLGWDLAPIATFDEIGGLHEADDGAVWVLSYGDEVRLERIDRDGTVDTTRSLDSWVRLVGSFDGDAVISSTWAGAPYRIAPDGSTELQTETIAINGGRDWILTIDCDDGLLCRPELVDLATGRSADVGVELEGIAFQSAATSWDGRRAVIVNFGRSGPETAAVLDAGALTVEPADITASQFFGPGRGGYDPDLRYSFRPERDLTIGDVRSGERIVVESGVPVREVLVAPEGWTPPGR